MLDRFGICIKATTAAGSRSSMLALVVWPGERPGRLCPGLEMRIVDKNYTQSELWTTTRNIREIETLGDNWRLASTHWLKARLDYMAKKRKTRAYKV